MASWTHVRIPCVVSQIPIRIPVWSVRPLSESLYGQSDPCQNPLYGQSDPCQNPLCGQSDSYQNPLCGQSDPYQNPCMVSQTPVRIPRYACRAHLCFTLTEVYTILQWQCYNDSNHCGIFRFWPLRLMMVS